MRMHTIAALPAVVLLLGVAATDARGDKMQRDVDGDARSDLVATDPVSDVESPAQLVIFGAPRFDFDLRSSAGTMRLQAPRGAHAAKLAGDVDGDGRGDVVVAHGGTADGRAAASVVWGSPSREPLVVGTNTMRSTLISALGPLLDVHPVGDVNGDGLADLLVASWAGEGASQVEVLFGERDRAALAPGHRGRRVRALGIRARDLSIVQYAEPAGDVDGDASGDFLLGLSRETYCGEGGGSCGSAAFIVYGSTGIGPLRLSGSDRRGYRVTDALGRTAGTHLAGNLGDRGAGVGDVDGDGLGDVGLLGYTGRSAALVRGGRRHARLRIPDSDSLAAWRSTPRARPIFDVEGPYPATPFVGGLGDITGDGVEDMLIAEARRARARLLPGRRGGRRAVHLRTTRAGTSIVIPNSYPSHVDRIAPAGDVDGDGHADASMRVLTDAAESSSGRFDERLVVLFGPVTSPRIYALRQGPQVRILQ